MHREAGMTMDEMQEIGNLISALQNPPTHVPDQFELRKMSMEFVAHACQLNALPRYEAIEQLLEDATKTYDYLNKR